MALGITRWERRDAAGREEVGNAALELCRALRHEEGIEDARFYWTGVDSLAVVATATSAEAITRVPSPAAARANFALANYARQTGAETWMDPRDGQMMWESAGRP